MRQIQGTSVLSFVDNDLGHLVLGSIESAPNGAASIPTTTLSFARGATIVDRSTSIEYCNIGTAAAPVWALSGSSFGTDPQMMQLALNSLAPADIIAAGAGQLSSANGLIMVAAPATGSGLVNVWHRTIVSYTFGTAAYTGGGNTVVAIGGGGATLSGLIATTTLWQNASSIIQEFVPLSTVAFPITKETSINLKTASAITNPGTAAGTVKVYTWYSQVLI